MNRHCSRRPPSRKADLDSTSACSASASDATSATLVRPVPVASADWPPCGRPLAAATTSRQFPRVQRADARRPAPSISGRESERVSAFPTVCPRRRGPQVSSAPPPARRRIRPQGNACAAPSPRSRSKAASRVKELLLAARCWYHRGASEADEIRRYAHRVRLPRLRSRFIKPAAPSKFVTGVSDWLAVANLARSSAARPDAETGTCRCRFLNHLCQRISCSLHRARRCTVCSDWPGGRRPGGRAEQTIGACCGCHA